MEAPAADATQSRFELGKSQLAMAVAFVCTVAVCSVAIGLAGLDHLLPRTDPRGTLQVQAYASTSAVPDILILGSSRADFGIDVELLESELADAADGEWDAYLLGLWGNKSWVQYRLLETLVARHPPRRLLVLCIEPRYFGGSLDTQARGLHMLGRIGDLAAIPPSELSGGEARELLLTPFRGIQVLWNLDWLVRESTRERVRDLQETSGTMSNKLRSELAREQHLARRGLGGTADLAAPETTGEAGDRPEAADRFSALELEGFLRSLAIAETLPCEVVFLRLPIASSVEEDPAGTLLARFQREVARTIVARGFRYLDLNAEPELRNEILFERDGTHLGPAGRRRVTRRLAEELAEVLAADRDPEGEGDGSPGR